MEQPYQFPPPFLTRLRHHLRMWGRKTVRARGSVDCSITVFVGHNRAVTHLNSQQLCYHTQYLHKVKPAKIQAWKEEKAQNLTPI